MREEASSAGTGGTAGAVARWSVHVHATPAAAVAEMDARSREGNAWLAVTRRDVRNAPGGGGPTIVEASAQGGRASPSGDPDPAPSPEETPPVDPVERARPAPDGIDPAHMPPGLPGGVPGGPPDVPRQP